MHPNVTYVFIYFKQIPPQRLLFCETKEGKISLARALEVDLHVDADKDTIKDLSRFVPKLALVKHATSRADNNSILNDLNKSDNIIMASCLRDVLHN